MNYDFLILTPSYNRIEPLVAEVLHLRECAESRGYKCLHVIVDDASDPEQRYRERLHELRTPQYRIKHVKNKQHQNRDRFWCTYDRLIKEAQGVRFRYCVALADDVIIARDFFFRVRRHFDFCREQDNRCVCMNISSRFPTNWGSSRYIDCAFICTRQFFTALNWKMEPISENRFSGGKQKRFRSSGVGQQMTRRIAAGSFRIAPVSGISYIKSVGAPSVMFPPTRFADRPPSTPWECNFIDE